MFQWAFTACQFINGCGKGGLEPTEQLRLLISSVPQSSQPNGLDELYLKILTQTFDADSLKVMYRFQVVMGRILVAKEPFSMTGLRELYYGEDIVDIVGLVISRLGSLLSGVSEASVPVQPLHTSFHDFLMDHTRSGPFFVDVSLHHRSLALACLQVMKVGLQFNICNLETSYVHNNDIPDLPERIKEAIPMHLAYACRFWADHLHVTSPDTVTVLRRFQAFMHEDLLYWLSRC